MHLEMTPLCELARKYETDKGGKHLRKNGGDSDQTHDYTPIYYQLMKDKQFTAKRILEVGIDGGASLKMWRDFFPNATIYGLDLNPFCLLQSERIVSARADQGDANSLMRALSFFDGPGMDYSQYDFIIEDGSHHVEHQIFTANFLVNFLTQDGVYVIEDLRNSCHPSEVTDHLRTDGFKWELVPAGFGMGKASHCACKGEGVGPNVCDKPEHLIVIRRG
jgi:hypothetical protein